MSDGKKFAPKALASAEERLADVEQKFTVIQQRIQSYDAVLEEFRALKAELKGNKKTVEAFVSGNSSIFDELRLKVDTYAAQFQILHAKADSNAKSLDEHKNFFNKFTATHNKIFQDFNEAVSKIKESVSKVLEENVEFKKSQNEIIIALNNLDKPIRTAKIQIDKLTDSHIKFKDVAEESQASQAKEIVKLKQSIAALPSLQEWANTLYGRIQQDAAYREKQATAYVDTKVSQLAKDFDANPLSAEGVKTALFNEIQSLALDGKNAYLKSNNCATQISLLEKKLENLNLLIKKYELNK